MHKQRTEDLSLNACPSSSSFVTREASGMLLFFSSMPPSLPHDRVDLYNPLTQVLDSRNLNFFC